MRLGLGLSTGLGGLARIGVGRGGLWAGGRARGPSGAYASVFEGEHRPRATFAGHVGDAEGDPQEPRHSKVERINGQPAENGGRFITFALNDQTTFSTTLTPDGVEALRRALG